MATSPTGDYSELDELRGDIEQPEGGGGSTLSIYEPYLGLPATDGYVLSSTTAGVRSWVSGGGGGSGTAYLYADQTFTGINNFGAATLDPSDATFSDQPTLRLADSSYILIDGDTTGAAGYIANISGTIFMGNAAGSGFDAGAGLFYGVPGGTLDLATQALSGLWSFYGAASDAATTPQVMFDRGATVKARIGAAKSATDTFWTGLDFTINSTIGLDGIGGGTADDPARSPWLLQGEYEWVNTTLRRQSELNSTFANRRWMNAIIRTQVGLTASTTGTGTITITCAEAHGMTGTPTVVLTGTNSTPSLNGSYTATPTTYNQFTIPFAGTITGALTAGWLYDPLSNYKFGGLNFTIPTVWDIPEYEIGTAIGTSAWYLRKVGIVPEAAEFTIDGAATGSSANIAALRLTTHSGATWNDSLGTKKGEYVWYVGFDSGFSRSNANTFGLWDGVVGAWRQWIDASGNFGIGNTAPTSKLDVTGTVTATALDSATWTGATTLQDENANALLNFNATVDAVNQITIVNGATGNAPVITSTGSDTNVGLVIGTAGTGNLELGSLGLIAMTGSVAQDVNGAASKPAFQIFGTPFSGTGTTSFPLVYINDADATASTTLNTAGTYFGVNGNGTQDLMNLLKDGASVFKVASNGAATATSLTTSGQILAAGGSLGAPGISFSALTATGFYTDGSSDVLFARGGVDNFKIRSTGFLIHQNNALFWGGNGSVGSPDTSLSRNAAGIVQFGTGTIGSAGSWTATNGTLSGTLSVTGASTFTGALTANGGAGIGTAATSTSFLAIVAGTTAKSQINLAVSAAPTSPVDGDIWREDNTNTGLKIRVNGVTKTITLS